MDLLLITNSQNFSENLKKELNEKKHNIKIVEFNFSTENIKKIEKAINTTSVCLSYCEHEIEIDELLLLSYVTGLTVSKNILFISNSNLMSRIKITGKSNIKVKETPDLILKFLNKEYLHLLEKSKIVESKNKLFELGIPFTPDCFSMYISKKNKDDICQLFIDGGIDINSKDDLGTPILNNAVRNENLNLVKQILELGADINCTSEDRGYTPVMDAVWKGNEEITSYLIRKGADLNTINKEGQNNLVLAVGANKTNICKLLVENGANPDIKDSMGMSAYGYASLFKKEEILEILKPYHKE